MTYYRTIDEDLKRAKEILKDGKQEAPTNPSNGASPVTSNCGIFGKDNYAAYKLLESFVGTIERDRFYYHDLEEAMRRVVQEVKGAPSMLLRDNKPYKAIPEELADAIEKLV